MPTQRAVIFVNGKVRSFTGVRALLRPDDLLIAADGGLYHLLRLGLKPHLLVGDLDSVNPADLPALENAGVIIRRFPVDKDETDLELAILTAIEQDCRSILLVGALGGRLDQTLGNLFLLTQPALQEMDVRMDDGMEEVFLVRSSADLTGRAGDIVSLLPLNGPATGVVTSGLRYPLQDETLHPDRTRGISNRMLGNSASISLKQGLLVCIHTRNKRRTI
jgi:thiamine pyrophosphokinase